MLYLKGLKKSHKISRLLQIAIALALVAGLVQLWQSSLLQGQQLLKSQTEKMARLLVQQTAYGAAPALLLQNDEQLQWLATALVEDPKVMSAAIYGEQGTRLSFAQRVSDDMLDPDSDELKALLAPYPPFVEPVIQDNTNLGYVEVRLDPSLFLAEIEQAHRLNMDQQQIMLLVAGIIGMLLTRSLSFKRAHFDRRRYRAKRLKQAADAASKSKADHQPLTDTKKSQDDTSDSIESDKYDSAENDSIESDKYDSAENDSAQTDDSQMDSQEADTIATDEATDEPKAKGKRRKR